MAAESPVRKVTIESVDKVRFEDETHVDPYVDSRRLFSSPDVLEVTFPPNARLEHHAHPADTLYVIQAGEFHIQDEDVYRPGDLRFVKGGFAYGPEWAGPDGAVLLVIAVSGPHGITW